MKINSVTLYTRLAGELYPFYAQTLGLPATREADGFSITLPRSTLRFQTDSEAFTYHFAFLIPANKIEEAREWMKGRAELLWIKDYEGVIAEFVNWQARSLYFRDPAGNIVELIARFGLHNETPAPFDAAQILSVSEIGVVFPPAAIEEETARLREGSGLPYFSRQKPFPQFKALGDDEGLFIVVTANRPWYPTDTPSMLAPLQIRFEQEGTVHELSW